MVWKLEAPYLIILLCKVGGGPSRKNGRFQYQLPPPISSPPPLFIILIPSSAGGGGCEEWSWSNYTLPPFPFFFLCCPFPPLLSAVIFGTSVSILAPNAGQNSVKVCVITYTKFWKNSGNILELLCNPPLFPEQWFSNQAVYGPSPGERILSLQEMKILFVRGRLRFLYYSSPHFCAPLYAPGTVYPS